jgi:Mor family transcriptional regulator
MQRCINAVLDYIYSRVPAKVPKIDKKLRDAQIYERHLQGVMNDELAKRFQLIVKHVERIIRKQQRTL